MVQWDHLEGNQASVIILHVDNLHLNNVNDLSVKVIKRTFKILFALSYIKKKKNHIEMSHEVGELNLQIHPFSKAGIEVTSLLDPSMQLQNPVLA